MNQPTNQPTNQPRPGIVPARAGRVIQPSATCANCPAPLTKSRGAWVHPWLYTGTCQNPTAVPGTEKESER